MAILLAFFVLLQFALITNFRGCSKNNTLQFHATLRSFYVTFYCYSDFYGFMDSPLHVNMPYKVDLISCGKIHRPSSFFTLQFKDLLQKVVLDNITSHQNLISSASSLNLPLDNKQDYCPPNSSQLRWTLRKKDIIPSSS